MLAAVWGLSLLIGFIVFGVLFGGLAPMIGMATSILGGNAMGGMAVLLRGEGGELGGSSYALAAGIGFDVLWSLAGALLSLVTLLGLNLVNSRLREGLDDDEEQAAQRTASRSAAALSTHTGGDPGQSTGGATSEHNPDTAWPATALASDSSFATQPQSLSPPESPAVPGTPTRVLACPHCLSAVGASDAFCSVCGYKLR